MKAVDLFCGGGGASMGISYAGFEVSGVDIKPQPEYPFEMIVGNALDTDLSDADFVWASPPCQCFTKYKNCRPDLPTKYEDLIVPVRQMLIEWGGVYIIENVPGAPLNNPAVLCGSMFGLDIKRHRLFESNIPLKANGLCNHSVWPPNRFPGGRSRERGGPRALCRNTIEIGRWNISLKTQQEAMGISWMKNLRMISEAIPPVYAEFLSKQVMDFLSDGLVTARDDSAVFFGVRLER